jgi:hypothetical protein
VKNSPVPSEDNTLTGSGGVRRYAIRRVNPFLGVLQVIETADSRAASANGVAWDIQIRAERQPLWGSLNQNDREMAWYRYGLWSEQDGLVSRPLAPHLDPQFFRQECNRLIERIRECLERLPFRLEDNRELWLFDRADRQPLALLAAARPGGAPPSPEPKSWSSSLGTSGVPSQRRYPETSALEAMIRQQAGFNINKHWVTRQEDGSGLIETSNTRLPAAVFPAFLLVEDWPEAEQVQLASGYIEWIAPSLLTLQNLGRHERARLEKCLTIQAGSVEHHWHLYPEIIDTNCIRAARVQCGLQKAGQDVSTT